MRWHEEGLSMSFVSGILLVNASKEDLEQAQGSKEHMRGSKKYIASPLNQFKLSYFCHSRLGQQAYKEKRRIRLFAGYREKN
jgi:hypothetical protein